MTGSSEIKYRSPHKSEAVETEEKRCPHCPFGLENILLKFLEPPLSVY